MRSSWRRLVAALVATAVTAIACGDGDSRAEWEAKREEWNSGLANWKANEPHAYAYWFRWGDMESPGYSIRVEIVDGEVVRTDLGPESRADFHGPSAPTIDDVFGLLDRAILDAADAELPTLTIERHDDFGFPTDVSFSDDSVADRFYGFGVAGFEVIQATANEWSRVPGPVPTCSANESRQIEPNGDSEVSSSERVRPTATRDAVSRR